MNCSNCESAEATFICKECGMAFCGKCDKEIHSIPIFAGHKRCETSTVSLGTCPAHGKLELQFCEDCLECCCWECMCNGQKHAGHKIVSYEVAYEKRKAVLEQRLAELRSVATISRAIETVLERETQRWADQCQTVRDKIAGSFERAAAAVERRKEEVIEQIEQRFSENDKVLNDAMTEFRATEEASQNALAGGLDLSANQTDNLAKIGRVEHSIQAMTEINSRILHKVLPASYTVKFQPTFAPKGEKEEKKDDSAEATEEEKEDAKNPLFEALARFGVVEKVVNGDSFDKVLEVKTVTNAEGKSTKDIGDTHISFTWESAPVCYLEHARAGKLTFALKMRTIDGNTEKGLSDEAKEAALTAVYSGPDAEYRCEGLEERKSYAFRLYALGKGDFCFWKTAEVAVSLGSYQGKWRTDCPRVKVDAANPVIVNAGEGSRDTVIADTPLTPGVVNRWKIRLVHSGDGWWEWLGVAPGDIDLSSHSNETSCGWYLNTLRTTLYCGPPFKWDSKKYGTNAEREIPKGSIVGLTMDMAAGTLAYTVNGKDYGVAYKGIPLDKPLFPAAVFNSSKQKIELLPWNADESEVPVAGGDSDDDDDDGGDGDDDSHSGGSDTDDDGSGYDS